MKNTNEKALNDFLEVEEEPKTDCDVELTTKSKILDEREGLIERVDRILVTSDGRQLLREQY